MKGFIWSLEAESFSWSIVDLVEIKRKCRWTGCEDISSFGDVLSEKAVGVFIGYVSISAHAGRAGLVNFWAGGCSIGGDELVEAVGLGLAVRS